MTAQIGGEVRKGGEGSGAKRQAQTYGDTVDDWRGNGACVVFTPVMDRHQRKDGNRPAFSVCHAVSINVVKHDGANAKPCDSMQNGMERHGMGWEQRSCDGAIAQKTKPD